MGKNKILTVLVFGLIFCFYLFWYLQIKDQVPVMDERFHFPQIMQFSRFDYTPSKSLGMGPGYHIFISFFVYLLKLSTVQSVRLLNLVFSFLSIIIFYITAKKIEKKEALLKTLLFAFFSINSIYFLFLYTDIFSTLLITLSFYLVLQKKYSLSGLMCIFSLVVRQSNIFFMAFLYLLIYIQSNNLKVSFKLIAEHLKNTIIFDAGFIGFIIYFILNPSVAYGFESQVFSNPKLSFNNVYFLLFLYFYLYLPDNIALFVKIIEFVKKRVLYIIIGIAGLYPFFILTFQNIHPWNVTPHLLRNILMIIFTANIRSKTVFFVVMIFSILALCVTKLHKKQYYFIYVFSFLMLMWIWLVEPRYYILPFTFFMLVRKTESGKMMFLTILLNAVISIYLIGGTFSLKFYP